MSIYNDGTMDVLLNGRKDKRTCEFKLTEFGRRYVPDIKDTETLAFPFGSIYPHITTNKE